VSGLMYFKYRWYDSNLQRWLNRDPIGEEGGLSLFSFVDNDPLDESDAEGLAGFGNPIPSVIVYDPIANTGDVGRAGLFSNPNPQGGQIIIETARNFLEPVNFTLSLKDIYSNPKDPWAYLGVIPFVKLGKCIPKGLIEGTSEKIKNLLRAAQKEFPSKAGKIEQHHIHPKYLGGDPNGPRIPLDAAYHQKITTEFRNNWPYGQAPPTPEELQRIIQDVYSKYPLPPVGK
jgi:hypothetical protein